MIHDFQFMRAHLQKTRIYRGAGVHAVIGEYLCELYSTEASTHYEELQRPTLEDLTIEPIVLCKGAHSKGGQSVGPLEASLRTKLPSGFGELYEQFGESVIFTRSEPIWIMPLQAMIDAYEDDPDIKVEEGRFFRFAEFSGMAFWLGFRRDDLTNEWQIVACNYGLLYSEMIGPQGRETVVANSFYDWLKALIETDGDLANLYPRYPFGPHLVVDDEPDKTS